MKPFLHVPITLLAALALLGFSACSTMKTQSGHDPSYDFSRVRSWDWAPQSGDLQTPAATKTAERIRLDDLVRAHVVRLLEKKGYVHQVGGADILVAWAFGEWQLERSSRPGGGYGAVGLMYPGAHGSLVPESRDGRALPASLDPYSSTYEQAKFEFVVVDGKTQRIVWNASITDDGDFGYFTSVQRDRIGEAVDQILGGFPPTR